MASVKEWVLEGGPRAPKVRGGFGGFFGPTGLNGVFLTEMYSICA